MSWAGQATSRRGRQLMVVIPTRASELGQALLVDSPGVTVSGEDSSAWRVVSSPVAQDSLRSRCPDSGDSRHRSDRQFGW